MSVEKPLLCRALSSRLAALPICIASKHALFINQSKTKNNENWELIVELLPLSFGTRPAVHPFITKKKKRKRKHAALVFKMFKIYAQVTLYSYLSRLLILLDLVPNLSL